jgi:hypothetical protein
MYTSLRGKDCKTISIDKESGGSVQRCSGVGGYTLRVLDDDSRVSITVVAPNGVEFPLDYWSVVTSNFSSLGEKAEWRVIKRNGKVVPIALIVRVNSQGDGTTTSYLAVARITPKHICVTDRISPSTNANDLARTAADNSAGKECLSSP